MNGLRIDLVLCLSTCLASMPLYAADECLTADVCLGTWDATSKCVASDTVHGAGHPYSLGDQLVVSVKGLCNKRVNALLDAKNPDNVNITLVLQGIDMQKLPLHLSRITADPALLTFELTRSSQDEPNRVAWTQLLGTRHSNGARTVELAIAMGNDMPINVTMPGGAASTIVFEVTTVARLAWTIVLAALVTVGLYAAFVMSPSVLRDSSGGVYSLGRAQIAFWLLLVLACLISIFVITGSLERLPTQVLILLGISSATSFAAKIVGNTKATSLHAEATQLVADAAVDPATFAVGTGPARLEKVSRALTPKASSARDFLRDICSDGDGVSIYRVQVVLFTVTLGGVFVWTVCQVVAMPEFPPELLTLLGLSNSTYVALKVPEST